MLQESGLEDGFIESSLYGSSSTMALLQGKSYSKGIWGHKLIMEALLRLKWEAFCPWVSKGGGGGVESEGGSILNLVNSIIVRYRTTTTAEEKKEAYLLLCNTATCFEDLLPMRFKQESSSKLYKLWDKYIKKILLLLEFIRAEREGEWELHLKVTTKMIPYFFAMVSVYYGYALSARKSSRRLQRVR